MWQMKKGHVISMQIVRVEHDMIVYYQSHVWKIQAIHGDTCTLRHHIDNGVSSRQAPSVELRHLFIRYQNDYKTNTLGGIIPIMESCWPRLIDFVDTEKLVEYRQFRGVAHVETGEQPDLIKHLHFKPEQGREYFLGIDQAREKDEHVVCICVTHINTDGTWSVDDFFRVVERGVPLSESQIESSINFIRNKYNNATIARERGIQSGIELINRNRVYFRKENNE